MRKLLTTVFKGHGRITIDGRDFVGRNITINDDRVIVDGVEQEGYLVGPVSIAITGDVERLETTSGDVEVSGTCGSVSTMSGDVICRDVTGNVSTMSGDVTSGKIAGKVSSMSGDVSSR